MFSKALDAVLPRKEANPYIDDFKFLSQKRQMLRNFYGGVALSLREDGKKVQQLIDDHIRSLQISKIMDVREITDSTFLSDAVKLTTEKAHLNPAYYEKMKERLESLINDEKEERKEDAEYFNSYKKILEELLEQEKEREKLGLANAFEHAIFEELLKIIKNKELSKSITKKIAENIKTETELVRWKTKRSSEKQLSITIYDILSESKNKKIENKIDDLTEEFISLAKRNL
jgi:type I restriction enzyme, R subunit